VTVAEETYKVVGGLEVAGILNGETITRSKLLEFDPNVNVDALVEGGHLELVKGGAQAKSETKKAGE
jgi:hypothetical protein